MYFHYTIINAQTKCTYDAYEFVMFVGSSC